jgi:hypothetical protein
VQIGLEIFNGSRITVKDRIVTYTGHQLDDQIDDDLRILKPIIGLINEVFIKFPAGRPFVIRIFGNGTFENPPA